MAKLVGKLSTSDDPAVSECGNASDVTIGEPLFHIEFKI